MLAEFAAVVVAVPAFAVATGEAGDMGRPAALAWARPRSAHVGSLSSRLTQGAGAADKRGALDVLTSADITVFASELHAAVDM